ncbi:hypothetical protein MAR_027394, partial [Mya arenaria]
MYVNSICNYGIRDLLKTYQWTFVMASPDIHIKSQRPNCRLAVKPDDNLTIGQKLLREPIWIGMIVILNIVFLSCVSYVVRRKCGTKIAKMLPKRQRRPANDSK